MAVLFFPKVYKLFCHVKKGPLEEMEQESKLNSMKHVMSALDKSSSEGTLFYQGDGDGSSLLDVYQVNDDSKKDAFMSRFNDTLSLSCIASAADTTCVSILSLPGKMANATYLVLSSSRMFLFSC